MSEPTTDTATTTPAATPAAPVPAPVANTETFSLEYVQQLRGEAAKYRTDKNDAVTQAKTDVAAEWKPQLAEAKKASSILEGELALSKLALLKLTKVLEAEIPSDSALAIADLVKGTDEESVSESVKTVKALLGKNPPKDSAVDPSQGSGQGHIPLNGDPILDRLKSIVGVPTH